MNKQLILITGASAGIGKSFVEQYIKAGHNIIGVDLDQTGLNALQEKHPEQFKSVCMDLLSIKDFASFSEEFVTEHGLPDLWINNAGIARVGAFAEIKDDVLDMVMRLNFDVMAKFCQHIIPKMQARGSGKMINMASVAGHVPCPFISSYSASKFALVGYTRSIQAELEYKKSPVKLFLVSPGFINNTKLFNTENLGVFQKNFNKFATTIDKTVQSIIKSINNNETFINPTVNGSLILKMNWLSPKLGKVFSRISTSKNYKQMLGIEKIDSL